MRKLDIKTNVKTLGANNFLQLYVNMQRVMVWHFFGLRDANQTSMCLDP